MFILSNEKFYIIIMLMMIAACSLSITPEPVDEVVEEGSSLCCKWKFCIMNYRSLETKVTCICYSKQIRSFEWDCQREKHFFFLVSEIDQWVCCMTKPDFYVPNGWEFLSQVAYFPELLISEYHLFHLM